MASPGAPPILLRALAAAVPGVEIVVAGPAALDTAIVTVTDDSRDVRPGALFVARRGARSDGHAFIPDATRAGAVALLVERARVAEVHAPGVAVLTADHIERAGPLLADAALGHPARSLHLAGVTGTNGKSTICHLLAQLLDHAGVPCGLVGTVEIHTGGETPRPRLTTPSAFELARYLAAMRDHSLRAAAIEVSSHALDQGRVAALTFDTAVFTNLSGDHLDYHGTMEAYAAAKRTLFDTLDADAHALINTDDEWGGAMAQACTGRVLRCSATDGSADVLARVVADDLDGLAIRLRLPAGELEARTPLIGRHNLMNLAQAAAAASLAGAPLDAVAAALERARPPAGRLERVGGAAGPAVLVDFAHTDAALRATLASVAPLARQRGGRLITVFGCGGDRDRTKRPRMARAAADHADALVLTSDNPRTEDPLEIIRQVLAGLTDDERAAVRTEPDRAAAITLAIETATPDDVVVIAGKGHEAEQLSPDGAGGVTARPFDDREVARGVLERRYPDDESARAAGPPGVRA